MLFFLHVYVLFMNVWFISVSLREDLSVSASHLSPGDQRLRVSQIGDTVPLMLSLIRPDTARKSPSLSPMFNSCSSQCDTFSLNSAPTKSRC